MTDNLGLISRLQSSLPYPEPFPNLTLALDWDVTNEIVLGLRSLAVPPVLQHVKGHQDSHTAFSSLSLDAQLNVEADAEAEFYQCTYPAQRPLVPRVWSNAVQLHILGKVICSRFTAQ